jgi:RNA polymerase sigma factor (sigma-70 family)
LSEQSEKPVSPSHDSDHIWKRQLLSEAIEQHWTDLLAGIRVYIKRFGLAEDYPSVEKLSQGILQDTVITALQSPGNYDPSRQACPWLLGIAINQIRRLRRKKSYEDKHVTLAADTSQVRETIQCTGSDLSEDEMIDLLYYHGQQLGTASQTTFNDLLSLVSDSDQEVLRLAFEGNLRGKSLAAELRISEGAAWARLSRATRRLREAYAQSERELGEAQ